MGSMENSIYYCCVSKGDRILYAYSSGDDEFENLAVLCLEKTPPYHKWYFETIGKRRFGFLMEDGYVYFSIADVSLGKLGLLHFLEHIRDEFAKMNTGLRDSMSNLDSLVLQEQLVPVIRNLISTLEKVSETPECLKETPSPPVQTEVVISAKAPLLGKSSKLEKKKMKEHAIEMRDIQLEEHRRSTDRVIKTDSGDLDSNRQDASILRKDSAGIRQSNSNVQRKYRRQVRIVLAIDAAVCLLLLLIWLLICGGTKCL